MIEQDILGKFLHEKEILSPEKWRIFVRKYIIDQQKLEYIALNDTFWKARFEAINKITSLDILKTSAKDDKSWSVRIQAIKNLEYSLEERTINPNLPIKLDDQEFFEELYLDEMNNNVKWAIICRITRLSTLLQIYVNEDNEIIKEKLENQIEYTLRPEIFDGEYTDYVMYQFASLVVKLGLRSSYYWKFVSLMTHFYYNNNFTGSRWQTEICIAEIFLKYYESKLSFSWDLDHLLVYQEAFYKKIITNFNKFYEELLIERFWDIETALHLKPAIQHVAVLILIKLKTHPQLTLPENFEEITKSLTPYFEFIKGGNTKGYQRDNFLGPRDYIEISILEAINKVNPLQEIRGTSKFVQFAVAKMIPSEEIAYKSFRKTDERVRWVLASKIRKESAIRRIMSYEKSEYVRAKLAKNVRDEKLAISLCKMETSEHAGEILAELIQNEEIIEELLINHPLHAVRRIMAQKITNSSQIHRIILEENMEEYLEILMPKLNNKQLQALLLVDYTRIFAKKLLNVRNSKKL